MMKLEVRPISSMDKVLLEPSLNAQPLTAATALKGEVFSFQFAVKNATPWHDENAWSPVLPVTAGLSLESKLPAQLREVRSVPVDIPCFTKDTCLMREKPGYYPDLLTDFPGYYLFPAENWRSFWVTVRIPANCKAGKYPITLRLEELDASSRKVENPVIQTATLTLEVLPAKPAKQTILRYEWFHADCLATYYNVPTWSEKHWEVMENFIRTGAEHGMNVLMTPLWTPPLDTAIGGERPTTQLLIIRKKGKKYTFDLSRLERYVDMALKCGITHFAMSHAFTQWGAKATPKIVAEINGKEQRIFGWDVPANSPEYKDFLTQLMKVLLPFFREKGLWKNIFFSVSDEPTLENIESYAYASKLMDSLLEGAPTLDALSSFEFHKRGLVQNPVPANNHIEPFVGNVKDLYTYYCCGQCNGVPNRFITQHGSQTRVMGVMFYLYNIVGFLQWGYNFYYSHQSKEVIDPYRDTCGRNWVPGGDPFIVYPGKDGKAEDSLRHELFYDAIQDLNVMRALEKKIGRDAVIALIHEGLNYRISMTDYPHSTEWLMQLREKLNRYLAAK